MSVPDPGVRRIAQVALSVADLDRAIGFYRDVLGLRFLFQAPPGLAFFDCGGTRLMLAMPEPGERPSTSVLYYESRGHRGRGGGAWMEFLKDSEGNIFGITEER